MARLEVQVEALQRDLAVRSSRVKTPQGHRHDLFDPKIFLKQKNCDECLFDQTIYFTKLIKQFVDQKKFAFCCVILHTVNCFFKNKSWLSAGKGLGQLCESQVFQAS